MDESEYPELIQPATSFAQMGGGLWVAEHSDQVVGSVGIIAVALPDQMEMKKLYTLSTVRGIGLGRQLIEYAEEEARSRQIQTMHLWTDTRFTTAHRVYERLGYRRLPASRTLNDVSRSVEFHYQKRL
jgi:putative acetyltransferase